jgi:hypothetical protein
MLGHVGQDQRFAGVLRRSHQGEARHPDRRSATRQKEVKAHRADHQHVAELLRQLGYQGVQLARLEHRLGPQPSARIRRLGLALERHGRGAAGAALALSQEGVSQRPQEVAEVVLGAQQTRAPKHPREGLPHEVLGLLA